MLAVALMKTLFLKIQSYFLKLHNIYVIRHEISVSGNCEAIIELSSPSPHPLGIYLIESNG